VVGASNKEIFYYAISQKIKALIPDTVSIMISLPLVVEVAWVYVASVDFPERGVPIERS
jgi:hypothetical protein